MSPPNGNHPTPLQPDAKGQPPLAPQSRSSRRRSFLPRRGTINSMMGEPLITIATPRMETTTITFLMKKSNAAMPSTLLSRAPIPQPRLHLHPTFAPMDWTRPRIPRKRDCPKRLHRAQQRRGFDRHPCGIAVVAEAASPATIGFSKKWKTWSSAEAEAATLPPLPRGPPPDPLRSWSTWIGRLLHLLHLLRLHRNRYHSSHSNHPFYCNHNTSSNNNNLHSICPRHQPLLLRVCTLPLLPSIPSDLLPPQATPSSSHNLKVLHLPNNNINNNNNNINNNSHNNNTKPPTSLSKNNNSFSCNNNTRCFNNNSCNNNCCYNNNNTPRRCLNNRALFPRAMMGWRYHQVMAPGVGRRLCRPIGNPRLPEEITRHTFQRQLPPPLRPSRRVHKCNSCSHNSNNIWDNSNPSLLPLPTHGCINKPLWPSFARKIPPLILQHWKKNVPSTCLLVHV